MRRALLLPLLLAGILTPAAAHAGDFYVTQDAVPRVATSCPLRNPCTLEAGLTAADTAGDVVHVGSGDYAVEVQTLSVNSGVTVLGEGASRPRITLGRTLKVQSGATPTRIEHLEVFGHIELYENAEGIDLVARSSSQTCCTTGVYLVGGSLHQSLVVATGAQAVGVNAQYSDTYLTSSTVIADGTGARAVVAQVDGYDGCTNPLDTPSFAVSNVIARGTAGDLEAQGAKSKDCDTTAKMVVSHSNFRTATVAEENGVISQGPGNQTSSALTDDAAIFADTTLYRQKDGAPTQDAGAASGTVIFPADVDGQARVQEAGIDIGVDELPTPPHATTPEAVDVGQNGAVIRAVVTPNGSETRVVFDYGPSDSYGSTTGVQVLPGDAGATTVQARLDGLAAGSTFHYRVRAYNPDESVQPQSFVSADATFATLSPPPPPVVAHPQLPVPPVLSGLTAKKSLKLGRFSRKGLKVGFILGRPATAYVVKLTARLRVKGKLRTVTLARARGSAGPGPQTVTLRPSRKTVKRLRRKRRVKAKLAVSTTPASGASQSVTIRR